jgi:serine/threonine protein kinase
MSRPFSKYNDPPRHDASRLDAASLGPIDHVEELLGDCLAQPQHEWRAALERLCTEHPTHADLLRRRFAALERAGFAHEPGSQGSDLAMVKELAERDPVLAEAFADAAGVARTSVPGLTDTRLGTLLAGRYRLLARIGAGAMGVVYRGHDESLRRDVAIKLLDAAQLPEDKAKARFLQEAELLAGLRHDGIVTLHDRGQSERGELFLVMELLAGEPLTRVLAALADRPNDPAAVAELLGGEKLPETTVLRLIARWGAELAEGLAVAHGAGILHRDIKPSNVFIRADGRAVLLDFGIATRGGDLTAAGTVLGTPWYMAPEQAIADSKLTPALDVYGLCSCLYHLLAQRPPFEGEPLAVLARIAREDPPRLSAMRPDLPRDLRAIVETGMARSPKDRYASMQLLAADLRAFLAHRPVSARPLSLAGRVLRHAKRHPARAALLATALLAGGLGLGLYGAHARETTRSNLARKVEEMAKLPESLAIEGLPRQRLLDLVRGEHRAFLAQLDAILALDPDDLPARLWRAALRLDEGEHAAAAADLGHAAAQAPTPYLAAVAQRYQRAARDRRGTEAVDLGNIETTPSTPADCFVAGFHELRNRHIDGFAKRADEWLARAASAYPPARELRLLALVARGDYENPIHFTTAVNESLRVEGQLGRGTARTYAVRGAALTGMGRCEEALVPLHKALELCPDRHGPLQNLAVAYRELGDADKAKEFSARAYALRPHFANTAFIRAQILMDAGEFAAAAEVVRQVPEDDQPDLAWRKPYLLAVIATQELCALYRQRAPVADLTAVATRAYADLDVAAQHSPAGYRARNDNRRALIGALSRGDDEEASVRLLRHLSDNPTDYLSLRNLGLLLPATALSARQIAYLRLFLATLSHKQGAQGQVQQQAMRLALDGVQHFEDEFKTMQQGTTK